MAHSAIEWTNSTWNPVTGCTKISAGCQHCYAERMARRLKAMGQPNYTNGFRVTTHPHMLGLPARWSRPQAIFVNSMGDLFHERVSVRFIQQVFDAMNRAPWHRYQILTKRAERLLELDPLLPWAPHVWMGVTVENQDYVSRIDDLRRTHAATKFLSLEPLIGPLPDLDLDGIDWVIAGGESGPGARPMAADWARDVRDRCLSLSIPFFFKQWGGTNRKKTGRVLDGRVWNQMPPLDRASARVASG